MDLSDLRERDTPVALRAGVRGIGLQKQTVDFQLLLRTL
jgi:hypothetical protein